VRKPASSAYSQICSRLSQEVVDLSIDTGRLYREVNYLGLPVDKTGKATGQGYWQGQVLAYAAQYSDKPFALSKCLGRAEAIAPLFVSMQPPAAQE